MDLNKIVLSSLLVLATGSSPVLEPIAQPSVVSFSGTTSSIKENLQPIFHSLFDPAIYFGAGIFFGFLSFLSGAGWLASQLIPWDLTVGHEFLISSELLGMASIYSFSQVFKTSWLFSFLFDYTPSSHSAWDMNKKLLSQIPAFSIQDRELVNFLEKHWLAKVTGCYPFHVNWLCPSFGIPFQVHPESTNSYSRDPATKSSDTYRNRVEAWKDLLPHPKEFPLILTRPFNMQAHLPHCLEILKGETLESFMERLSMTMHKVHSPVIVDLTAALLNQALDRTEWMKDWRSLSQQLLKLSEDKEMNLSQLLCIQRVQQSGMGGIRLLPFLSAFKENTEEHYQYLLEWISRFGLTANRIELDRPLFSSGTSLPEPTLVVHSGMEFASNAQWISFLESIEQNWKSKHPQKTFMFKGTLQILKGLAEVVSEKKWQDVTQSPTRSAIVQLSFKKIKQQLELLTQEDETVPFHPIATKVEQIHADFTALLEIFLPYVPKDFPAIYKKHLTSIPKELFPLTTYAIHSSSMTSLGAIFQTIEKNVGRPARILYGENTYFEIINLAERVSHAVSIKEATILDLKDVDLILVQFNPTVKRINFKVTEYQATEYHIEKIAEILHSVLKVRGGKPLSVAIDCTLDFSDSKRVGEFLTEFQKQIEQGELNVLCYRSGLKFDLFGMDNYCGAPFFMVNNRSEKWSSFDALLTDPVLLTDSLSLNWFCLVYQHAAPYLESYRKQIFDNTRAVLNKIPTRLFNQDNPYYRVIPMDSDINPTFIDIKIFGPLHTFRGDLNVGVYLTLKCMEAGYPLLYRPGIGFFHPNLAVLFGKECTTVRLTVGLDPAQIDVIVHCLEKIDVCNGHQNLRSHEF